MGAKITFLKIVLIVIPAMTAIRGTLLRLVCVKKVRFQWNWIMGNRLVLRKVRGFRIV